MKIPKKFIRKLARKVAKACVREVEALGMTQVTLVLRKDETYEHDGHERWHNSKHINRIDFRHAIDRDDAPLSDETLPHPNEDAWAREQAEYEATRERERDAIRTAEAEYERGEYIHLRDKKPTPGIDLELNADWGASLEKWSDGNACLVLTGPIVNQVKGLLSARDNKACYYFEDKGAILFEEDSIRRKQLTLRIPLHPRKASEIEVTPEGKLREVAQHGGDEKPSIEVLNPDTPNEETHGRYAVRRRRLEIKLDDYTGSLKQMRQAIYRALRKHRAPFEWRPVILGEVMSVPICEEDGYIDMNLAQSIADEVEELFEAQAK